MHEIEHLLGALAPLIREYGAWVVLVAIAVEAVGVPAPAETLLVFAAALAAQGELSWPALLAGAWAGAIIGDNIGFAIGRYAGRALVLRFGERFGLTPERLDKIESMYKAYGPLAVALARFVAFLRQINGPAAGALNMAWRRFLAYEAIGAGLWASFWTLVGYFVGEHAAALLTLAHKLWPAALVAAALLAGALIVRMLVRRRPS